MENNFRKNHAMEAFKVGYGLHTVHFIHADIVFAMGSMVDECCPTCGMPISDIEDNPSHMLTSSAFAFSRMDTTKYKACKEAIDERSQDTSSHDAESGCVGESKTTRNKV